MRIEKKKSVLTCTRGGMDMPVSLFCSFSSEKRSLEHVFSMMSASRSL